MEVETLVGEVTESFYEFYKNDKRVTKLLAYARDGTATYEHANDYAVRVGNALAKAYKSNLTALEDIDYEIAYALLNSPLRGNYKLIARYTEEIQNLLNASYGMEINPIVPAYDVARVEALAQTIADTPVGKSVEMYFEEKVIGFGQSIVDSFVHDNADFASDLGFSPQIIREYEGPHREHTNHKGGGNMADCEWCLNLAGTYDYADVKNSGNDVYKRHDGCRCKVTYIPAKYSKSRMGTSGNAFIRA